MPALSIPCRDAARLPGGHHGCTPARKTVTTARRPGLRIAAPVRALTRKTKTSTTAKTAD